MISIAEWRYQSTRKLRAKQDSEDIEINAILTFVLQKDLAWCLTHPDVFIEASQQHELDQKLEQLLLGVPLPYILGRANFYNSSFLVDQYVLIPRPETELLVENAIQWIDKHPNIQKIVDVGTGSGVIILSIKKLFPKIRGFGVDISRNALQVAAMNKINLSVQATDFVQMDCLSGFNTKFDLILANLPYIPTSDVGNLDVSKYEPMLALDGGKEGLEIIKKFVKQLPAYIKSPGLILMEVQYDQAQKVRLLVREALPEAKVSVLKDYAFIERFVRIEV